MSESASSAITGSPVRAETVSKTYGSYEVLRGVSCEIAAGEFVAIMGDSGSGKTTFLNLMAGLDTADQGVLRVGSTEPGRLSVDALSDYRRRQVAMIFQDFNLLPTLSVIENLTLPVLLRGEEADEDQARAYLNRVGILGHADSSVRTLSGGEMQRVAIARALNLKPRLLLADEPTGSLDSRNTFEVLALLQEINRDSGVTLVMVTHSADAAKSAGRILHMQDGRLLGSE